MIAPGLCSRGVSGANEQQREKGGRRGWWLVGLLAVSGAAIGAFAGHRLDPDVRELAPSLAVAGFGLGGLVGLFLLAPVGGWRAWRRWRARRRMATSAHPDMPDGPGLWHSADVEREVALAGAAEAPGRVVVEAPAGETEPVLPGEPASGPGAEEAAALTPQQRESECEQEEEPAAGTPGLEPEEPPPPGRRLAGTPTQHATACAAFGTARLDRPRLAWPHTGAHAESPRPPLTTTTALRGPCRSWFQANSSSVRARFRRCGAVPNEYEALLGAGSVT